MKEVIRAFRTLLHGCEEQWHYAAQQDSESSESEAEEALCQESPYAVMVQWATDEDLAFQFENRSAIYVMTGFNQLRWQGSLEL